MRNEYSTDLIERGGESKKEREREEVESRIIENLCYRNVV